MKIKLLTAACLTAATVGFTGGADAVPIVIMDATTNNGSFTLNEDGDPTPRGSWYSPVDVPTVFKPAGWEGSGGLNNVNWGFTIIDPEDGQTTQNWHQFAAVNNTGVTVTQDTVYSVSARANINSATHPVNVRVVATKNSDGSGTAVTLAVATLAAGTALVGYPDFFTAPPLLPIAATSGVTTSAVDGYFVQVRVDTVGSNNASGYYYVDDIVVTAIPEPASALLLGLGASALMLRRKRVA
jgi:hypothetical protein